MNKKIVIVGAGPTGIGAAWHLQKQNYESFKIFERQAYVGGLSASFKDGQDFTWDVGGHVLFSHYKYFDDFFDEVTKQQFLQHMRSSWVWIYDKFVPYPFQNNIRFLPKEILLECVLKLIESEGPEGMKKAANFDEWLLAAFGQGIYNHFQKPYNSKVWGTPLNMMAKDWIAERVSTINIPRIIENIIMEKDDISWGPNNKFKFPLFGGTGAIWEGARPAIESNLYLEKELIKILWKEKKAIFSGNVVEDYDHLITTAPLKELVQILDPVVPELVKAAEDLVFNSGIMVGVGFEKPCPDDKCWMYFPMSDSPFYRVTYFSNYSPNNVPDSRKYYSLMGEITYSEYKKFDLSQAVDETVKGFINSKLIEEDDLKSIVSAWMTDIKYSYPVPTLKRDSALKAIIPALEKMDIYSRGRFGGWRYEIGNMDHSFMQGVELVDRLLKNIPEKTIA